MSLPRPGPSGLQKQPVSQFPPMKKAEKGDYIESITHNIIDDQIPRKTVPTMSTTPTKIHKIARYDVSSMYISCICILIFL
jgi:hypothetical protein